MDAAQVTAGGILTAGFDPETMESRLVVPANSRHYWRYRMHITLEELLKADELNKMITQKIAESGR